MCVCVCVCLDTCLSVCLPVFLLCGCDQIIFILREMGVPDTIFVKMLKEDLAKVRRLPERWFHLPSESLSCSCSL